MNDPNDLVTIAAFEDTIRARLLASMLEGSGIECHIADEHTATINPFYSFAIGGVKVRVRRSDLESAMELMADVGYTPADGDDASVETYADEAERCPACGSEDVGYERLSFIKTFLFLLSTLVSAFMPMPSRKSKCSRCEHEWK